MSMKISVVGGCPGASTELMSGHKRDGPGVIYPGKVGVPALPDKVKCLYYFY